MHKLWSRLREQLDSLWLAVVWLSENRGWRCRLGSLKRRQLYRRTSPVRVVVRRVVVVLGSKARLWQIVSA